MIERAMMVARCIAVGVVALAAVSAAKSPHILFIVADDVRFHHWLDDSLDIEFLVELASVHSLQGWICSARLPRTICENSIPKHQQTLCGTASYMV